MRFYAEAGRPGLPPGRYFRLLLIGYFEGLDAERAIAWRAAVSFAIKGKTVGIDATTLEANAALRSIVRRDTGETYHDFLTKLAQASRRRRVRIWYGSLAPSGGAQTAARFPSDTLRGTPTDSARQKEPDLASPVSARSRGVRYPYG